MALAHICASRLGFYRSAAFSQGQSEAEQWGILLHSGSGLTPLDLHKHFQTLIQGARCAEQIRRRCLRMLAENPCPLAQFGIVTVIFSSLVPSLTSGFSESSC